jgi:hypothetical protein
MASWNELPHGYHIDPTFALTVCRGYAFNSAKLDQLHATFLKCPFIKLGSDEVAALKEKMKELLNRGHNGRICINVEGRNRYVWLD